jgi:hypothetical protein
MNTKRILLFLIGCIGSRVALVLLAYNYPKLLFPMSFIALTISLGFMYIWVNNLRQHPAEAGGDKVWWNDMRPIHSLLWGTFAYMAYNGSPNAWKILALDVTLGFSVWVNHRILLK